MASETAVCRRHCSLVSCLVLRNDKHIYLWFFPTPLSDKLAVLCSAQPKRIRNEWETLKERSDISKTKTKSKCCSWSGVTDKCWESFGANLSGLLTEILCYAAATQTDWSDKIRQYYYIFWKYKYFFSIAIISLIFIQNVDSAISNCRPQYSILTSNLFCAEQCAMWTSIRKMLLRIKN